MARCLPDGVCHFYLAAMIKLASRFLWVGTALALSHCGVVGYKGELMGGPEPQARKHAIASEPTGDFYYGRRYHVHKTRFWGYLREPRQPWNKAKLVMMREDRMKVPDRLPEESVVGESFGYDQNFEYRIRGYYTGRMAYDPNSNQILPEFMLTGYELINSDPGWLFTPEDRYHPKYISLRPR